MYEAVPADLVVQAAEALARAWRERGSNGVLAHNVRQLRGRMWRLGGAHVDDTSLADTLLVLRTRLTLHFTTFDQAVFVQPRGLPIGGPLSDLGAALLLGKRLLGAAPAPCASPLTLPNSAAQIAVTALKLVLRQHPSIPFSIECRSDDCPLRWLDMMVHCRGSPIDVSLGLHERESVEWRTPHPTRVRNRGASHIDASGLRAHVRGAVTSWPTIQLRRSESLRWLDYNTQLFVRSSYPLEMVIRPWTRNIGDHLLDLLVRALFSRLHARIALLPPCA